MTLDAVHVHDDARRVVRTAAETNHADNAVGEFQGGILQGVRRTRAPDVEEQTPWVVQPLLTEQRFTVHLDSDAHDAVGKGRTSDLTDGDRIQR